MVIAGNSPLFFVCGTVNAVYKYSHRLHFYCQAWENAMQDNEHKTEENKTKEDEQKEKLRKALRDWKDSIFYMVISIAITAIILKFLHG